MEDYPAGPTGPGPARPSLTVVIPVHNGGPGFERCLVRLRDSRFRDFELVVVDDGSGDGSGDVARRHGARVIRNERPQGPASARNAGARAAQGSLVFFLDADVAVHPETLDRALAHFKARPELSGLFGSYDDRPEAPGLISRFRNLLHHFVHQDGQFERDETRPARTFWTGCGMVRRSVFLLLGGFDPRLYRKPAIEDIEFGYRMTRAGHSIVLARDVRATHLKRWTLPDMIRTDIARRGVPWMLLQWRWGVRETDLNVRSGQKLCVIAVGLAGLAVLGAPWLPVLPLLMALAASATIVGVNRGFYRFLIRSRGAAFAVGSIPPHAIYYVCCGVSVLAALAIWWRSERRSASVRSETGAIPRPHLDATRAPTTEGARRSSQP